MRRLIVLTLLAAAAAVPGTANASTPCRDRIYNDWYQDGKIASTYPLACYRDALAHVPNDARIYSSLAGDIRSAMQAAIERSKGSTVPAQVGKGLPASRAGGVKEANISLTKKKSRSSKTTNTSLTRPSQVVKNQPRVSAAPVASTSSGGGGLPLPIIVLGALALVLAATGAIGAGVKHFRR